MLQRIVWVTFLFLSMAWAVPGVAQSDAPDEVKTYILKDGSVVKGTLIEEGEDYFRVKTPFGELRVNKADLKKTHLRLSLNDGSTVVGTLVEESAESYVLQTSMGTLTIPKGEVKSFEKNLEGRRPAGSVGGGRGGASEFLPQGGKAREGEGFSHSIEPLIDIFFDPTGYTFEEGDIYVSGLSMGYGLSDDLLMSVNVVKFVGFIGGEFNPNLELKYNVFESRSEGLETFVSVGVRGELFGHLADKRTQYTEDSVFRQDEWNNWCDRRGESRVELGSQTVRRWRESRDGYEDGELEPHDAGRPTSQADCDSRTYSDYEPRQGWRTQLYLASTFSRLMERGGRMSLHLGGIFEMNEVHTDEWSWAERPSFRVYSAFDLDVSRGFKLLGEFFYDPDYAAILRDDSPKVGVDFGVMWAYSETLRFLIHLDAPFVGIYWRF